MKRKKLTEVYRLVLDYVAIHEETVHQEGGAFTFTNSDTGQ